MLTIAVLGLIVGAVMGLTGAGGGVLAVPALVAIMGWSVAEAAPVALTAVTSGAWVGTINSLRAGIARYRAALWMAVLGVPATTLGLWAAQHTPERALKILFALLLLWLAFRFFKRPRAVSAEARAERKLHAPLHAETGRFVWNASTVALLGAMGVVAGFAAGLLGVGGGFVLVPLLKRFTKLSMHQIVATSLMVIALVSLGGVASAYAHGVAIAWPHSAWFAGATILGVLASRSLAPHLSETTVQRGFAVLLVVAAGAMIAKVLLP